MSGEVQADIADAYRFARRDVEQAVESALRERDYGAALARLSLISIILEDESGFDEIKKYDKNKRQFEMRLKIPHQQFQAADAQFRRQMVAYTLLRAVKEMRALGVPGIDYERLESDVASAVASRGWT
jgi:hypothetical protein